MNNKAIELRGCTAEPLMAYLKSLGILRLLGEQVDPSICGYWQNGAFNITGLPGRGEIIEFFLNRYRPTPVITPWNNASGYYSKGPTELIDSILDSTGARFEAYREAVSEARRILEELEVSGNPTAEEKQAIIGGIRSSLSDTVVEWIDALGVLADDRLSFAPLLGTGGNDGRLEFAVNYMQHLFRILPLNDVEGESPLASQSRAWLILSLFDEGSPALVPSSTGQFNPGGVKAPNASQGFIGEGMVNPWDYVLMIEGSLMLAGSVACSSGLNARQKAAFPFTVRPSPAGWHTISEADTEDARYELWMPLWEKPAGKNEVSHLLREGRAQVGKRPAATGTDFARAAAALGVDRGLSSFTRYAFYKRSGKAYLASPLGRVSVRYRSNIDLLEEADHWLQRVRRFTREDNAPGSLKRAFRSAENAIFAFCGKGGAENLQVILAAFSSIERVIARSKGLQKSIDPLQALSMRWLSAANDGSPEYYLARAAASIYGLQADGENRKLPSIRSFLEPVEQESSGRYRWAPESTSCVWTGDDLVRNLQALLTRRCMDAARVGFADYAPVGGHYSAKLEDIALFHRGDLDENKLTTLLQAFSLLRWPNYEPEANGRGPVEKAPPEISRLYCICKTFFHHGPLPVTDEKLEQTSVIRPYQQLLVRLKKGDGEAAVRLAVEKLKAGGFLPLGSSGGRNRRIPAIGSGGAEARRIGASLLFPVENPKPLMRLVLRDNY